MNTIECIKKRRSIRKFEDQPLSHQMLDEIVTAASFAPSWKNTQIARYTIIESRDIIDELKKNVTLDYKGNIDIMESAPVLMVLTIVKNRSGFERDGTASTKKGDGWEMFDAGIACQTFCLAASEKGVGTVIMGLFDDEEVAKTLDIGDEEKVVALVAMGYPAETPNPPRRKTADELARYIGR